MSAFRAAYETRRCLAPASGFYECREMKRWMLPYLIGFKDGRLEMKLGAIPIVTAAKTEKRISLLLCSSSGYGKTTIADSAPCKKLWLLLDTDGSNAIASGKDVLIADFTRSPAEIVEKFEDEDPFNISEILADNPEIETVVFDSVRAFGDLALRNVVRAARNVAISDS